MADQISVVSRVLCENSKASPIFVIFHLCFECLKTIHFRHAEQRSIKLLLNCLHIWITVDQKSGLTKQTFSYSIGVYNSPDYAFGIHIYCIIYLHYVKITIYSNLNTDYWIVTGPKSVSGNLGFPNLSASILSAIS